MKCLKDTNVVNKRVLMRCDFNVPIDKKGNILDDFRIKQALPTISYLIDHRAKVILMSHLGDPQGEIVPELRLNKIAARLSNYLKFSIGKADDCVGLDIENAIDNLEFGGVLLLENLRFHKEETDCDPEFAKKLSYLGDVYVNDAFSVCHRKNASVTEVPEFLIHCAGLLLEQEVTNLGKIMKDPEKPLVALVGGTKVETKTKFINNLSKYADFIIVSGLIAKEIEEKGIQLDYPEKIVAPVGHWDAPDISEESVAIFREKIMQAKTILWNGPFGKFEEEKYAKGTWELARAVSESGAFSVVGGGETVEFLNKHDIIQKFSHVSTGGGAMLNFLSGEKLPGLIALA